MPELALIQDTLKEADGTLASGRMVITPSRSFIAGDGSAISGGPNHYTVTAGVVDLELAPTVDADAATTYQVQYFLSTKYTETWAVPRAAGGPFTIAQVRT